MTQQEDTIRRAGEYLASEYRARRPLDIMAQDFAPRSETEAYAIQDMFLKRLAELHGPPAGYKIAYTNAVMQRRAGISSPCSGLILSGRVHESPAKIDASGYERLGIECEVALLIGRDIPPSAAPYTRESVSNYIEWLAPSFELVDGRQAVDGSSPTPFLKAIVTNISNAGAVIGTPTTDWRTIDLADARGAMLVNGEVVGEGRGRDVMGHPVEPLAWLANTLAARDIGLKAGEIVLTGSFAPPHTLQRGDFAEIVIEELGKAQFTVS